MAGKPFFRNVASTLCRYPAGQKFLQNRSISHRFQDKCVFAFYAKIQDGHQKWQESDFCEKSPVHSTDTLWVKTFIESALSHTVSKINAFHAEIQDGHQKWRKSDFCEKLLVFLNF